MTIAQQLGTQAPLLGYGILAALVLLGAAHFIGRDLHINMRAVPYLLVSAAAAVVIITPIVQFGVVGTIESVIAWQHAFPQIGWMLAISLTIGAYLPFACSARALKLMGAAHREHNIERRIGSRVVAARLDQLRRDIAGN